jgi:hypothetical protein
MMTNLQKKEQDLLRALRAIEEDICYLEYSLNNNNNEKLYRLNKQRNKILHQLDELKNEK